MTTFQRVRERGWGVKRQPGLAAAVIAALLAAPTAGLGQIIENSAGPAAKDAGRVLKLAEVWRISDEGAEFFFQYPRNLQIAADGSIFLTDSPKEFLRFSPAGKFLENLFKVGQGPGEMGKGSAPDYRVRGHDLFVYDQIAKPPRMWRTDLEGHYQEESEVPPSDRTRLAGVLREGLLYWTITYPPREGRKEGKFIDLPQVLVLVPWEAGKRRDIATIMTRTFVSPRMTIPDEMIQVLSPDGKRLFFALGEEYLIQELDLTSGAVVRRFRRPYSRVPVPPHHKPEPVNEAARKMIEEDRRKGYFRPIHPFLNDIAWIGPFLVGGRLWVVTSTHHETKGWMIDVFDAEGRLADSFYLGKGREPIGVAEESVFCKEDGADDKVSVVKYRIVK